MKVGIVSDIHEDIVSLKKAIHEIERAQCDEIVCLGDIVGFGLPHYNFFDTRNATDCIAIVKSVCDLVLLGNHDLFAIRKLPEYSAGFNYPGNWYDLDFIERKSIADGQLWLYEDSELSALLSHADRAYLDSLSSFGVGTYENLDLLYTHFLFPDISGTTTRKPNKPDELLQHYEFIEYHKCNFSISGHGHIEGAAIISPEGVKYLDFGIHAIEPGIKAILGPCIAAGTRQNGFIIFNTNDFLLDVRRI